jgi:probable F420-dependent oxidoreductase
MRRLRFGLVWDGTGSPVEVARRAESAGYATLLFPDHTGMVAPLPAMAAAAAVTSRIRLGTQVVNIAFRPLGALAQDLAAVDIISTGRLDIGLGAGAAGGEVRSLGLRFPSAADRVRALDRALDLMPRLFAGETITETSGEPAATEVTPAGLAVAGPAASTKTVAGAATGLLADYRLDPVPPQGASVPLMVGGNRDRLLTVAARKAGIVQFVGFTHRGSGSDYRYFSDDGLADRIAYVAKAAGERDPELSVLLQWAGVVPDPLATAEDLRSVGADVLTPEQALRGPFVQLGTSVDQVCEQILDLRARHGISYFTVFDRRSPGFDAVVRRLAG